MKPKPEIKVSDFPLVREENRKVLKTLTTARGVIATEVNPDLPAEVTAQLSRLAALAGSTAISSAMAYTRLMERRQEVARSMEKGISATEYKTLVDAGSAEEKALYDWSEKLHKEIAHSITAYTTILSWLKTEKLTAPKQEG